MSTPDDFQRLKEAAQILLQNAAKRYEEPLRQEKIRVQSLSAQLAAEKARARQEMDSLEAKIAALESQLRVQRIRNEELEGQARADQEIKTRFVDDRRQSETALFEFQQALKAQVNHTETVGKTLRFAERRIAQLEGAILRYHQTCQRLLERDRAFRKAMDSARGQFQSLKNEVLAYRNWVVRVQAEQKEVQRRWMEAQKAANQHQLALSAAKLEIDRLNKDLENQNIQFTKEKAAAKEWETTQFEEIDLLKNKLAYAHGQKADLETRLKESESHFSAERSKYETYIQSLQAQIEQQKAEAAALENKHRAISDESRQSYEDRTNVLQRTLEQLTMSLRATAEEREKFEKENNFFRLELEKLRLEYPVRDLLRKKEEEVDQVRQELEKEGLHGERRQKLCEFLDLLVDQQACLGRMVEKKQVTPPPMRFIPRSVPSC